MEFAQQTARLLSAANTTNDTLVLGRPGRVYGVGGFNAGTITYLKLYDKATAPVVGTDTPRRTIYLPANTAFQIDFANPLHFAQGIGYGMATAGADNSTAAVASGAVLALNIDYS